MTAKSHYLLIKYWSHPQVLTSKLIWSDPWDQWLWSKEIKRFGDREKGREKERETKKERDHTGDKKEGHWVKWIEIDRCEEIDIVNKRERGAASDVFVNFCLLTLVKMSHINVQINGRLIFQPAPYCHHQMVLLTYLLMTRAEFPPPECQCTANFSWSLLIPCGPFNFALCSSDTANPPTCSHQKDTKIWSKANFLSLFILAFEFHLVLKAFFLHFSSLLPVVGKLLLNCSLTSYKLLSIKYLKG